MSAVTQPAEVATRRKTEAAVGPWRLRWRRFRSHRAGMISLLVLVLLVLFAAGRLPDAAHSSASTPMTTDLLSRFEPPSRGAPARHRRCRARRAGPADGGRPDVAAGRRAGDGGRRHHRPERRRHRRLFRRPRRCRADALHRWHDRLAAAAAADRVRRGRPDQTRLLQRVRAFRRRRLLADRVHHCPGRLDRDRPPGPRRHAGAQGAGLSSVPPRASGAGAAM